ncbi:Putative high-molecular-weight surface-exposed protein [Moritella viscosa]|nr:Putative high-molecular-weight surface-exposed protein [Moritella viscosa]
MYISGSGNSIFNNSISNSLTGITIQKAKNAEIYNNTVHSNVENSIGLSARDSINNVNVYDNDFNIEGLAIRFISINEKLGHENFSMYLNNNRFTSSGYNKAASVSRSRNVYFNENNFSNIGFIMYTSDNIQLIGNRVETKTRIGLQIEEGNEQIKLHDNLVIHPEKKKCIRNLSEQIPDIKNNVCMGI